MFFQPQGGQARQQGQAQIDSGRQQPDFKAQKAFRDGFPAAQGQIGHGNGADERAVLEQ